MMIEIMIVCLNCEYGGWNEINMIMEWRYENDCEWGYVEFENWDYIDVEILRLSLKWRFESGWNCNCDCNWDWDCGWLNWNDNLVVNWILMAYVWLLIV